MSSENDGKGRLFVVSGPSGAGKSTVIGRAMSQRGDMEFSISATTRPMREGEVHGKHYYFVNREEFMEMVENGGLLEYNAYLGNLYGTPLAPVRERIESGGLMILDVETNGAHNVKELMPDCVTIYLTPSTFEELERRLVRRGTEDADLISDRMAQARTDSVYAESFDYIIINDNIDDAVQDFMAIIDGSGDYCRASARIDSIEISAQSER